MRGRKPKPTALLKLAGNRRVRAQEGGARLHKPADVSGPPDFLGAIAAKKWQELVPLLQRIMALTEHDMDHVAAYCDAFGQWVEASRHLADEGLVITHHNKTTGCNPWLRVSEKAVDRMVRSGAELGLSPASRARLRIEIPQDDPLMDFLRGEPG